MSQRLIRKSVSSVKVHPRTGQPLRPVGVRRDGRLIWPIIGASEAEPEEGSTTEPEGGDPKENEGSGKEDEGSKGTVSLTEYERLKERMQAADRAKSAAEQKVKEYEDKGKTETERLGGQVQTLTEENTSLKDRINSLLFENAFALNTKQKWHDPAVVLEIVKKRDDISISDDGTIKGMDKALEDLAKTKPFLVNGEAEESGKNDPPASGSPVGSGRKEKSGKFDDAALRKKYPALNR